MLVACGAPAKPTRPPGPAAPSANPLPEGDAAGCPDGFRRFADPHAPPRFTFCAPAGSRIGATSSVDEHVGTIDHLYLGLDDSAAISFVATAKAPREGLGPSGFPSGARVDLDRTERFANRDARHFRVSYHQHRERSFALDDHGNHTHEEASDHDVVVETWAFPHASGAILRVTLRTQENTAPATAALLKQIAATFH